MVSATQGCEYDPIYCIYGTKDLHTGFLRF